MVMRTQRVAGVADRRGADRSRRSCSGNSEVRPARDLGQPAIAAADPSPRHRSVPVHPAAQHDARARRLRVDEARRQVVRPLRPLGLGRQLPPLPALSRRLRQRLRPTRRASRDQFHVHRARRSTSASTTSTTTARAPANALKFENQLREAYVDIKFRGQFQPARRQAADHLGRVGRLSPPRPRQRPRPLVALLLRGCRRRPSASTTSASRSG